MNSIKISKESLLEIAFLLFALLPLIPNRIKGLPVILLLLVSVIFFPLHKSKINYFFGFSFLYFLYIFSLVYTSNLTFAAKKLETSLSILILPFVFFILLSDYKISSHIKQRFIKLYIISATLFSIYSLINIFLDPTPFYKDYYANKFRMVVENMPLIGQHPIYASIFVALAVIFIVYNFNHLFQSKLWSIIFLFVNFSFLIMLSSRGVLAALFLVFLAFLLSLRFKFYYKLFLLGLLGFSLIILFVYNNRMKELLLPETYTTVNTNYSHSYRVAINRCSIKLIKENIFWGYGVGDVQDQLNNCYQNTSKLLLDRTYNSHNQYFDIWLKTGLIGFIYFLLFIMYLLFSNIKAKNYLLMAVVLFFAVNFLFENVLARQSGVILFYFLIGFLTLEKLNKTYAFQK
jgi:O-antigen ligase